MGDTEEKRRGLSYSSFAEFSACSRKWFIRKVLKSPIDPDAPESTEAFDIGKSFHKCLENTKHDLKGYTLGQCQEVCKEFNITDTDDVCLVYAMLGKYKELHARTNLKVLGCEVVVDTPTFYGVVDAVMYEDSVGVWIVDLKTSKSLQGFTLNTVSNHAQLNLYAKHYPEIAKAVGCEDLPFAGYRLRTTTKSTAKNTEEHLLGYVKKLMRAIKSYDTIVPVELLKNTEEIYKHHQRVNELTVSASAEDIDKFPPNFGNCNAYFKVCEYYSKCHGHTYSDSPKVKTLEV